MAQHHQLLDLLQFRDDTFALHREATEYGLPHAMRYRLIDAVSLIPVVERERERRMETHRKEGT